MDLTKKQRAVLQFLKDYRREHRMPPSYEEIRKELEESKEKIEAEIGRQVHFLSYPGNSYNPAVQKLSEQTGYRAAFAVDQSLTSFGEDHFTLRRIHVEDEPLHVFQAEISLLLPFLRSLFFGLVRKKRSNS